MAELTIIQRSPDPERSAAQSRTRRSIAEKIRAMGQNRIGALILLLATLAAIIWANVSVGSYEAFWETHLTVGVGDLQLDFTLHALVNDALMAIFFFTVGLEVRREFAIGELTSWSRAMVPVIAAVAGLAIPALLFAADRRRLGAGVRVGRRHLDRHRVPRRCAGAHRPARSGPTPGVPARARRRRRHRRAQHHRARLHRELQPDAAADRRRGAGRRVLHALPARRARAGLRDPGDHRVAGLPRLRRAPDARRRRDRAARARLPARPARRRARPRSRAHLPAVAEHRVRTRRREQPARVDLDQRAPAVGVRPVRRLRDPAAVRARQRGRGDQPGDPGRRHRVAAHVGHRRRPRRRQVPRRLRLRRRAAPAAARRVRARAHARPHRRRRGAVRHRLHDLALHRRHRDRRRGRAERGPGRRARGIRHRVPHRDRDLPHLRRRAPRPGVGPDPGPPGRPEARPRLRRRRRAVHDRRVRRLPVRILPQGLRIDPGGAQRARRPAPLRLAPRAAHGLPPERTGRGRSR